MEKCPNCGESTVLLFSDNIFRCSTSCRGFSKTASMCLWDALKNGWTVTFAGSDADHKKSYVLQKSGKYIATMAGYLGGVIYLEMAKGDDLEREENIKVIMEALFFAFGIYNLHVNDGRLLTYYPELQLQGVEK